MENYDESSSYLEGFGYVEEGANYDYFKAYRAARKTISASKKAMKKCLKEKDYKGAKKEVNNMEKALDLMEKEIRGTDSEVSNAVIGFILYTYTLIARNLIPFYGALFGVSLTAAGAGLASAGKTAIAKKFLAIGAPVNYISGIVANVMRIIELIKDISTSFEEAKRKDSKGENVFNLFRTRLLSVNKDLRKELDKLRDAIDKKEKADKG